MIDWVFWFTVSIIVFWAMIGFAILGIALVFVYRWVFFRCRVIVRELCDGRVSITEDWAKEVKDSAGVTVQWKRWRARGQPYDMSVPPQKAINILRNGRKQVEAYLLPTGEYEYLTDDAETKVLVPLSTAERNDLINSIVEAEARMGVDWKAQIPNIVSVGVLGIVILAGLIFAPTIMESISKMHSQNLAIEQERTSQLKIIEGLDKSVQNIEKIVSQQNPPREAPN